MDEITQDTRFSHIFKDAKFRKLPKKHVKVKIDERFRSMFHDPKFKIKCEVDKRGRAVKADSTDDLKRYYDVSESGSENEEEKEKGELIDVGDPVKITEKESIRKNDLLISEKEKQYLTPEIKKKLRDMGTDYARGERTIFSESSSDEETTESEGEYEEEFEHCWGELDKDAEYTDKITNRLAVCNLNWDRIEAVDLMVLFSSFLPKGGLIHSVTIYPSDFGNQRMKEEQEKGPKELLQDDNKDEKVEELPELLVEKIRKYQLNRLRYYYAVVVFDSPDTADAIYNECNGLDYECSSSKLDLRFIPDDCTFEQEPKEVCTSLPDLGTYKPRYFETSALTKAKVDLTWDETDPNRQEMVKSIHKGNIDESCLRKYLACSSSENDETEEEELTAVKNLENGDAGIDKKLSSIEKYKALLADAVLNENKAKKNAINMEVTWNLELEKKASELAKEAISEKEKKSPFQQYLEKKKAKRKEKKLEKQLKSEVAEINNDSDKAFSDDDIPSDIDLNDPYFKEELSTIKNKKQKKKEIIEEVESEETKQKKAELELLMMDDEPGIKHFNLKKIQQNEKSKSKKVKKGKKRKLEKSDSFQDEFKIDVNDERFSALYTSNYFNIDPADPQYKPTKGIQELIQEKLKRRREEEHSQEEGKKLAYDTDRTQEKELVTLIKNIKNKTSVMKKT